MQTILGSGGSIGIELAKSLKEYTNAVRLVSRTPEKVNPTDEIFPADVLIYDELERAVQDSDTVYVTVGFKYDYKVWKENWPDFMNNLIKICIENNMRLVFFDNVYMYDENCLDNMTESTPIKPSSKKGVIRADIADSIMREVRKGTLNALIARSADFYGPTDQHNSVLLETVFKPLNDRKKANWLGKDNCKHSFTFTRDAGRATAMLGNSESAYGQVWHLPTASNPLNGKEWVEAVAEKLGVKPRYRTVSPFFMKMTGLFNPVLGESVEMMYQYDRDYIFNSSKFEQHFDFTPTPYHDGIREILEAGLK